MFLRAIFLVVLWLQLHILGHINQAFLEPHVIVTGLTTSHLKMKFLKQNLDYVYLMA